MQFKERLRAQVAVAARFDAEMLGGLRGVAQYWFRVVVEKKRFEPDQVLGVVARRVGGFAGVGRNEMVYGVDTGGIGMAPGRALHGRQARKREEIAARLHADIREVEHVLRLLRDEFLGFAQGHRAAIGVVIGAAADRVGHRIGAAIERVDGHFEFVARQVRDRAAVQPPDRVGIEVARYEAHAYAS